jgi:tRNA (guanine37-N1)-methyltransferase
MKIDVLTLFPEMFGSPLSTAIFKRAFDRELLTIGLHNFRDWAHDKHHTVDDSPYGGGAGMVLKPGPLFEAVEAVKSGLTPEEASGVPVILLTPQGRLFSHRIAVELAAHSSLILICGHYEGVDERVRQYLATDEISIGDYVLSGGELAAMVLMDAVIRLVPGVLGSGDSIVNESHAGGLLEYPQYTRPPEFRDWTVPEVLLSGNHAEIEKWHREQAVIRTAERRPDLLDKADLTPAERRLAQEPKKR